MARKSWRAWVGAARGGCGPGFIEPVQFVAAVPARRFWDGRASAPAVAACAAGRHAVARKPRRFAERRA